MPKPPRKHPEFYYTIRDKVIAKMGPEFSEAEFKQFFPAAARPHNVIPYSDGYPDIRRIIRGLVKARMCGRNAKVPRVQARLAI